MGEISQETAQELLEASQDFLKQYLTAPGEKRLDEGPLNIDRIDAAIARACAELGEDDA